MRQAYGTNFISQSVAILTPVLVFLGPFVAFSVAMQWDFSPRESFNLFYGFFFGAVAWFLVCVAACLCASLPRPASSDEVMEAASFWRYARKCTKFVLMLLIVSISLLLTHRYDLSEKKERYEVVHSVFCGFDLSEPVHRLRQTHDTFGQLDHKHWAATTVKDSYMDALNTLSAWMDASSWDTTVIVADDKFYSVVSAATGYLPVKKSSIYDYPGMAYLPEPLRAPFCKIVRVDGRLKSLRVLASDDHKPIAILTRVREEKNKY